MRLFILTLPLLTVVLVAGCIGQTPSRQVQVSSNDGLIINSFIAEPPSVDVGDSVLFTLEVENTGGTRATDVVATLLGVEGQWRELAGPAVVDASRPLGSFAPPNPLFNQPGDFKQATWVYRTPDFPPGLQPQVEVTAQVIYSYNTTGSLVYRVIGKSFYRTEYQAKGRTPAGPVITNTNAPVKIVVPETQTGYYITVDDDASDNAVQFKPVQVRLVNVGSGFPVTGTVPGAIYGKISVRGPGNPYFQDCLGQSGVADVSITPGTIGAELAKLRTSQGSVTISCIVALQKAAFIMQDEQIRIDFNLGYRYYIQKPLTVLVSSIE